MFCPVTFGVLRDPHQTTCCGNHISVTASARLQREGKPCPMCKEPNFTTHADKYFKRVVNGLKVRCLHKGSGCEWMGDLGSLDQHANVFPKRPWRCQYCDFTTTYDVGANDHLPLCLKFPEPCPNKCEAGTVERCDLERHLATECPLQLVACEFSRAGCTEKVPRKDLARHMEENMQKHLLNMSLLNLSLTQELHEKMDEKDRQIAELQLQLEQRDGNAKQQFQQLDGKIQKLDGKVDRKFQQLDGNVKQQFRQLDGRVGHLQDLMHHTREFTVTNFSQMKGNDRNWTSDPFHYSFMQGYKFKFWLYFSCGTWMGVHLFLLPGEHDDRLLWPIKCTASIQILNQKEDRNHIEESQSWEWNRPTRQTYREISKILYSSLSTQAHLKGDCLRCKLRITITI